MSLESQMTRRAALALSLAPLVARAARAEPLRVTLATATPGGGFPAFGEAFAASIRLAEPEIVIETQPSGGSAENIALLRSRQVDLALIQGAYAYPALTAHDGLTVLAPMYPTPGLFVVRADGPVQAVDDLRGRAVALGTRNSGLTVLGRDVLAASGIDPDRDIRPVLLDHAGDGPAMVLDRRVAALWGGGLGWPGFVTVAKAEGGARFLGPSDAAIATLLARDSTLRRLTVPAGSFAGQERAITTASSWSLILARPGFPSETAYRLVATLVKALPTMRSRHAQGDASDPRRLPEIVEARVLNEGTRRYLAETGTRIE